MVHFFVAQRNAKPETITRGYELFDPVKYVKETLSRVEYACEMNFDPLARHDIF